MKYDFTIVTPSFNQADFIEETIKSVISQKGDFSIEYIIADGGSTDGSVDIISRYEHLIKKNNFKKKCKEISIVWWSRKDRGQSDALNKGFKKAQGRYVAWLNSDDTYLDGALDNALDAFSNNPDAVLVYGNFFEIDSDGKRLRRIYSGRDFSINKLVNWGNVVGQPAAFFTNSALTEAGYLNPEYHYAMDYDLWIKLGKIGSAKKIDKDLANFRLHGESKTVSLSDKFWKEERRIALNHGGKFFSEMLLMHYKSKYPKLKIKASKIKRTIKILLSFNYRLISSKIKKNLPAKSTNKHKKNIKT